VQDVLDRSGYTDLEGLDLLVGIPEYRVALPGGERASQTDLFVLARAAAGTLVAMAVEGKAEESFGRTIAAWRKDESEGKRERLRFLINVLDLVDDDRLQQARYQLLHGTASAVIEADRLHAGAAVMLVHSFSPSRRWLPDFAYFASLLRVADAKHDRVYGAGERRGRPLYVGWISDDHPSATDSA
jgi:hypothetical protein